MRKLVLAMAGAAALAISSAAGAQVSVVDTSITDVDGPTTLDGTTTIGYTEAGLDNPTFSEFLTFMNEVSGSSIRSRSTPARPGSISPALF